MFYSFQELVGCQTLKKQLLFLDLPSRSQTKFKKKKQNKRPQKKVRPKMLKESPEVRISPSRPANENTNRHVAGARPRSPATWKPPLLGKSARSSPHRRKGTKPVSQKKTKVVPTKENLFGIIWGEWKQGMIFFDRSWDHVRKSINCSPHDSQQYHSIGLFKKKKKRCTAKSHNGKDRSKSLPGLVQERDHTLWTCLVGLPRRLHHPVGPPTEFRPQAL